MSGTHFLKGAGAKSSQRTEWCKLERSTHWLETTEVGAVQNMKRKQANEEYSHPREDRDRETQNKRESESGTHDLDIVEISSGQDIETMSQKVILTSWRW